MKLRAPKALLRVQLFVILIAIAKLSLAQTSTASLSGIVTDGSGKPVPNVSVVVKNVATGEQSTVQTDASGSYAVDHAAPGDYEISVNAPGVCAKTSNATLAADSHLTVNLSLTPVPGNEQNLPNAPSSTQQEPSLGDLGFSKSEVEANPEEQARLDKRTRMLKTHQKLGLITTVPLIATVITGFGAGGKKTSNTTRDWHAGLGSGTAALYFTTAYFAIRAPKIPGTETRGPIKVHKILAWIHGPGMILTPILGEMAFNQKNSGQKIHGAASLHAPVAIITAGAYGAALLSVSVKF